MAGGSSGGSGRLEHLSQHRLGRVEVGPLLERPTQGEASDDHEHDEDKASCDWSRPLIRVDGQAACLAGPPGPAPAECADRMARPKGGVVANIVVPAPGYLASTLQARGRDRGLLQGLMDAVQARPRDSTSRRPMRPA